MHCQTIDYDYVKYKRELTKKSGTYPKLADPKITPKWILTYPMRYIAQILPDVSTDIASHKKLSDD